MVLGIMANFGNLSVALIECGGAFIRELCASAHHPRVAIDVINIINFTICK